MPGDIDQGYGSLIEGVHLAGYSLERAFRKLEWLLDERRWEAVGDGFDNVNAFLDTIKLDGFKPLAIDRKRIAERIKQLQPQASNVRIAKMLGVDEATVRRDSSAFAEPAGKNASKTKGQEVSSSSNAEALSGAAAAKAVASAEAKEERRAATIERREAKQVIPADMPFMSERFSLIHSDIRQAKIAPSSIDCIVTDPPYPEEFIDVFGYLAECASMWLKPGGSLLCMSGQAHLPKVLAKLSQGDLSYQWTLAYLTPGGQAVQIFPRKVNAFWKPVFWFVKGEYTGDWIGDVTRSDVNDNDKRFHDWGQSESGMADLISRVSSPGQTILDPFCGGGTTGVVALKMNRLFIGIDSSSESISTTALRLHEVANAATMVA